MKDGKIDGTVITYFSNGRKESEKYYRNSLEHGTERRYDMSTGKTLIEGQWINGKKDGTWYEVIDAGGGITGIRLGLSSQASTGVISSRWWWLQTAQQLSMRIRVRSSRVRRFLAIKNWLHLPLRFPLKAVRLSLPFPAVWLMAMMGQ